MLIAEDLALLLLDDRRGSFRLDGSHRSPALAGAVLAELVLAGWMGPEGGDDRPRAKLVVLDASPTGDELLDAALATVGRHAPARPDRLLRPLARGLEDRLLERLVASGAVQERRAKVLGLFPVRRHPARDTGREQYVRASLASALRAGRAADPRLGVLVALLSVTGTLAKVVRPERLGLTRRELVTAGWRVAADDRVARAVKRALDGVNAAAVAAG